MKTNATNLSLNKGIKRNALKVVALRNFSSLTAYFEHLAREDYDHWFPRSDELTAQPISSALAHSASKPAAAAAFVDGLGHPAARAKSKKPRTQRN